MTLSEYRRRLAEVEAAISEVISTGKSYSITGSHSVTNHDFAALRIERDMLRKKILRLQGVGMGRTRPDFN